MNIKTCGIIFLLLMVIFSGCTKPKYTGHDPKNLQEFEIYPEKVAKMLKAGGVPVLIDLRSSDEYLKSHINQAISIPFDKLSLSELSKANLDAQSEIYVYDNSGRKGKDAVNILKSMGHENVHSIYGGFVHWEEDRYPVEAGEGLILQKDPGEVQGGPRISADERSYDFGKITQSGGVVTHDFLIENEGDETLEIMSISTSCACTSAEMDKKTLEPGESAIVKTTFDPNVHEEPEGRFKRTVFLETNDPENEEFQLTIYVEILVGE